jgi:hypothetical protein
MLQPGTRIGACEIVDVLGAGGMGDGLSRARDTAEARCCPVVSWVVFRRAGATGAGGWISSSGLVQASALSRLPQPRASMRDAIRRRMEGGKVVLT